MLLLFPKSYIHAYLETALGLAILYLYPHLWPAWYSMLMLFVFITFVGLITPRQGPLPRRPRPRRHHRRQNEPSLPWRILVGIVALLVAVYSLWSLISVAPVFAIKAAVQKVLFFVSFRNGMPSITFHGRLDDFKGWAADKFGLLVPLVGYIAVAVIWPLAFVWYASSNSARRLSWFAIFVVHFLLFSLALTILYPVLGIWGSLVDFAHRIVFENPGWETAAPKIVRIVI